MKNQNVSPYATPRANPVGITVIPDGFVQRPRAYGSAVRVAAALVLGAFLTVVVVTTSASLGAYCLTSDGANVSDLPASSEWHLMSQSPSPSMNLNNAAWNSSG